MSTVNKNAIEKALKDWCIQTPTNQSNGKTVELPLNFNSFFDLINTARGLNHAIKLVGISIESETKTTDPYEIAQALQSIAHVQSEILSFGLSEVLDVATGIE